MPSNSLPVKLMVSEGAINPHKPKSKRLVDLMWALDKGFVTIQMDHAKSKPIVPSKVTSLNSRSTGSLYILRRMPKEDEVQPQVRSILLAVKKLGGKATREQIVKALRMETKQDPAKVFSLKRRAILDHGYLQVKEVA
jgi:hypothetical protein